MQIERSPTRSLEAIGSRLPSCTVKHRTSSTPKASVNCEPTRFPKVRTKANFRHCLVTTK